MKHRWVAIWVSLGFLAGLAAGVHWARRNDSDASGSAGLPPARSSGRASEPDPGFSRDQLIAYAKTKREEDLRKQRAEDLDARVKPLIEGALQWDDAALRDKSIEDIRRAMRSTDPITATAGLTAFLRLQEIDFDKASFRKEILPHLEASDEALRAAAWGALLMSGLQPGDADHLREVAANGGMGDRTSYYLFQIEKGDLTGGSGEIVRRLIEGGDPAKMRSVVQGLWGAKFSPDLESDLIGLSRRPEMEHNTVYFALSTQQNKSEATVMRLLEVMAGADNDGTGGRAAWGLGGGVPPELQSRVADAAAKIVGSRTDGYVTNEAWRLLERYAGPDQLETLRAFSAKPNLGKERRQNLDRILARISQVK